MSKRIIFLIMTLFDGGCVYASMLSRLVIKNQYKRSLEKEQQDIFDRTDDLAKVDPEFYKVCLQIMKDYGIKENIHLRVYSSVEGLPVSTHIPGAMYYIGPFDIILIASGYRQKIRSLLIRQIAHELEHHRQFHKYPGSFHGNFFDQDRNDIRRKLETAADAVSLDYQHCSACIAAQRFLKHKPEETEHGYFTSPHGYATVVDAQLYYDRACAEGYPLCLAHESYGENAGFRTDIPLKYFLPTMKPSLPTAKFSGVEK